MFCCKEHQISLIGSIIRRGVKRFNRISLGVYDEISWRSDMIAANSALGSVLAMRCVDF